MEGSVSQPADRSAKFTPGPWKLKGAGTITDVDGDLIATTGYRVTAVDDEDAPSARLISASPDLYVALERGLPWLEELLTETPIVSSDLAAIIRSAHAALARARGEQP